MRIAYVTGGTVGAGHWMRGLALQRALRRRGFSGTFQLFGPRLPFPHAQGFGYCAVEIEPALLMEPARAAESALAKALVTFAPELVVVDLFWAPLQHVLPQLGCPAWLLVRKSPAAWFAGPPGMPFVPARYQRIFAIEPCDVPIAHERIAPVVVCNPEEARSREELAAALGVATGAEIAIVAHAGLPSEIETLARHAPSAHRCDLFDHGALFPLAQWLPAADRVVSAAGYNTFWEAQWLGYAARTRFIPMSRKIDDQAWRIALKPVRPRENGADVLAGRITDG